MDKVELEEKFDEINKVLETKILEPINLSRITKGIGEATKALNKATKELEAVFAKNAKSTSELVNTAWSYKEALMSNPLQNQNQSRQPSVEADGAINVVTDRKDRPVLIDVPEQQLLMFGTDAIQEKLQQAIKTVENPLPPADTSIAHISKSCMQGCMTGVIINFNAKETAN